mmetsp:Transcript_12037/g.32958  ORF Transcript_12037/g.32958 Transcript_12037/m.32958 type:complete len:264 (+) Transcript_12037:299-1090(+)
MSSGSSHWPIRFPSSPSKACAVAFTLRSRRPSGPSDRLTWRLSATTDPLARTWREPWVTGVERWCIDLSGTSCPSRSMSPRNCTMRPWLVPTTTQPTSSASKAQTPERSELWPRSRRQWLWTASASTRSWRTSRWSQSCPMVQFWRRVPGLRGVSTLPELFLLPSPSSFSSRGHSTRVGPTPRRTSAWQWRPGPVSVHTTLTSFRAWPSKAEQRSTRVNRRRRGAALPGAPGAALPATPRNSLPAPVCKEAFSGGLVLSSCVW